MATPKKKKTLSPVDDWLKRETSHKREALENASRHFDESDHLTVNTLEALYSKESSFGTKRGKRGSAGPAGDFQLKRKTATNLGLSTSSKNDQRFDVDNASAAAAKELKRLHDLFKNKTTLAPSLKTIPVSDSSERKKFALAAYNAGEGRIASAQRKAEEGGKNPEKWEEVKDYLEAAGASSKSSNETREYVEKVAEYEEEFRKKSNADQKAKNDKPKKMKNPPTGGHWITVKGQHIFIEDK